MLNKFSALFWHLNNWCLAHPECDLTQVECVMSKLVETWTEAMAVGIEDRTDRELADYMRALSIVRRF